jgi:hypothetical protein
MTVCFVILTRLRPTGYAEARLDSGSHRGTRFRVEPGMTVTLWIPAFAGMTKSGGGQRYEIPGRAPLLSGIKKR